MAREMTERPDIKPVRSDRRECEHKRLESDIGTIDYDGSSLEPWKISGASILRCSDCAEAFYSRTESRRWEINKAKELVRASRRLKPHEARFLRETAGVAQSQFAATWSINKSTVSRWETKYLPLNGDRITRAYFLLALLQADARGLALGELPARQVASVARKRTRLLGAALPEMGAADVSTMAELRGHPESPMAELPGDPEPPVDDDVLGDALLMERASIKRIQRGDKAGYHYFANAKQFSGRGVRELLESEGGDACASIRNYRHPVVTEPDDDD